MPFPRPSSAKLPAHSIPAAKTSAVTTSGAQVELPIPRWVISDTHWGHRPILEWYPWRQAFLQGASVGAALWPPLVPFASAEHLRCRLDVILSTLVHKTTFTPSLPDTSRELVLHDEVLIAAWNEVVAPDDWVLHLGDVAMGRWTQDRRALRQRLHGRIILVLGNHDCSVSAAQQEGFDVVLRRHAFFHPQLGHVVCHHNPCNFIREDPNRYNLFLHGHCHGREPDARIPEPLRRRSIDASMDHLRIPHPVPLYDLLRWKQAQLAASPL